MPAKSYLSMFTIKHRNTMLLHTNLITNITHIISDFETFLCHNLSQLLIDKISADSLMSFGSKFHLCVPYHLNVFLAYATFFKSRLVNNI